MLLKEAGGVHGVPTLGPMKPCPWSASLQWDTFAWSHPHPFGRALLRPGVEVPHHGQGLSLREHFLPVLLTLCTVDLGGWIILWGGSCPVHCRMLSSVPGLYALHASSTLTIVIKCCDVTRCPWETKSPLVRTWMNSVDSSPTLWHFSPLIWSLIASHSIGQVFVECPPLRDWRPPLELHLSVPSPTDFTALLPYPQKRLRPGDPGPPWFGTEIKTPVSYTPMWAKLPIPFTCRWLGPIYSVGLIHKHCKPHLLGWFSMN